MSKFDEFVAQTERAHGADSLCGVLHGALQERGYENVAFATIKQAQVARIPYSEFPDGYVEFYSENHCDRFDPIIDHSRLAQAPFYWSDVWERCNLTKQQMRFIDDCMALGVRDGFTVPLHGPFDQLALISGSRRQDTETGRGDGALLTAICTQFWVRWIELAEHDGVKQVLSDGTRLTNREIECLKWCKEGKSAWEISKILQISEKTAQFHVSNAMAKFGAPNRITAVVMALQRGLITL